MSVVPEPIVMLTFAKSLLPAQYRDKTNWDKLCAVIAKPFQDLEDAFQQLLLFRYVSVATGDVLDLLGALVDEGRNGRDDTAYRIRIKAKILLIKSSGTVPQILALLEALQPTQLKKLVPYYPATFVVDIDGITTAADANELAAMVAAAKAAGVRANITYSTVATADTFTWNGTAAQGWNDGEWAHTAEG